MDIKKVLRNRSDLYPDFCDCFIFYYIWIVLYPNNKNDDIKKTIQIEVIWYQIFCISFFMCIREMFYIITKQKTPKLV